ncbi:MAG: CoA transferase, partial [Firmicutes bacterium]|nr:CoA transferase [Bacillota bacterium]
HWIKFTGAIGQPWLSSEPMFLTVADRVRNIDQLEGILDPIFIERSRDEWIHLFEEIGVPVGRVNTVSEAAADPVLLAREMFSEVQFGATRLKVVGSPLHINGGSMTAAPIVAEFNANQSEILGSLLNMDSTQIEHFRKEGAFE